MGCLFLLSIVLMLLLYMEFMVLCHGGFPIKHSFNAFVIHGGSWDVFSY